MNRRPDEVGSVHTIPASIRPSCIRDDVLDWFGFRHVPIDLQRAVSPLAGHSRLWTPRKIGGYRPPLVGLADLHAEKGENPTEAPRGQATLATHEASDLIDVDSRPLG